MLLQEAWLYAVARASSSCALFEKMNFQFLCNGVPGVHLILEHQLLSFFRCSFGTSSAISFVFNVEIVLDHVDGEFDFLLERLEVMRIAKTSGGAVVSAADRVSDLNFPKEFAFRSAWSQVARRGHSWHPRDPKRRRPSCCCKKLGCMQWPEHRRLVHFSKK